MIRKMATSQCEDGVLVLLLLICSAEAVWEPLLVYNVAFAETISLPRVWEVFPTSTTNRSALELLPTVIGDKPFVSELKERWPIITPKMVEVFAVKYERGTAETLMSMMFHIESNASNFSSWLKTENLVNEAITTGEVTLYSQGSIFEYEYFDPDTNQHGGMAFLWDDELDRDKALLLTSEQWPVADAAEIRYLMTTQTETLVFPADTIPANSSKFSLYGLPKYKEGSLQSLHYESDVGVKISHIKVSGNAFNISYLLILQSFSGDGRLEFADDHAGFQVGHLSEGLRYFSVNIFTDEVVTSVNMTVQYTYMPYERADFLVINGYYGDDPGPLTSVSTTTTTGEQRQLIDKANPVSTTTKTGELGQQTDKAHPVTTTTTTGELGQHKDNAHPVSTTTTSEHRQLTDEAHHVSTTTTTSELGQQTDKAHHVSTTTTTSELGQQTDKANPVSTITTTSEHRQLTDKAHHVSTTTTTSELGQQTDKANPVSTITTTGEHREQTDKAHPISTTTTTSELGQQTDKARPVSTTATTGEHRQQTDNAHPVTTEPGPPTEAVQQKTSVRPEETFPTEICSEACCHKATWDSVTIESLIESGNQTAIEEILTLQKNLKTELTVNKSTLTMHRNKKISATDTRTSATGIGSLGVLVIVGVLSTVIFLDLAALLIK